MASNFATLLKDHAILEGRVNELERSLEAATTQIGKLTTKASTLSRWGWRIGGFIFGVSVIISYVGYNFASAALKELDEAKVSARKDIDEKLIESTKKLDEKEEQMVNVLDKHVAGKLNAEMARNAEKVFEAQSRLAVANQENFYALGKIAKFDENTGKLVLTVDSFELVPRNPEAKATSPAIRFAFEKARQWSSRVFGPDVEKEKNKYVPVVRGLFEGKCTVDIDMGSAPRATFAAMNQSNPFAPPEVPKRTSYSVIGSQGIVVESIWSHADLSQEMLFGPENSNPFSGQPTRILSGHKIELFAGMFDTDPAIVAASAASWSGDGTRVTASGGFRLCAKVGSIAEFSTYQPRSDGSIEEMLTEWGPRPK